MSFLGHRIKQIKTILIINAILLIFFEPAIVVGSYMTWALFKTIKNLVFKKKNRVWKKIWNLKKNTLSFENIWVFFKKKTLSVEKIWVLKKIHEFWKNLSFKKCFKIKFKKKTWALTKEKMIGLKIKPQTWNNKFYHSNFPK